MTENEIINKRLQILEARQNMYQALLFSLIDTHPNKAELEAAFLKQSELQMAHLLSTGISDDWIRSAESARDMITLSLHRHMP